MHYVPEYSRTTTLDVFRCLSHAVMPLTIRVYSFISHRTVLVIFCIGSTLQCGARSLLHLFLGRAIGGVGVGALSTLSPLYMAEISPPEVRGSLMALEQFAIVLGVVLGFWLGYFTRDSEYICNPYHNISPSTNIIFSSPRLCIMAYSSRRTNHSSCDTYSRLYLLAGFTTFARSTREIRRSHCEPGAIAT